MVFLLVINQGKKNKKNEKAQIARPRTKMKTEFKKKKRSNKCIILNAAST